MIKFEDLCGDEPLDNEKPILDRAEVNNLSDFQKQFRKDGVLEIKSLIPDYLIEIYSSVREKLYDPGGWNMPCPYLHYDEIKEISLYSPMMDIMKELIGEPMGLHLNLTGYVSTERNWHQDDYLNPSFVNSHYCAVWIALDDIDPNSGPFEFVRGSHQWPLIRREKVFEIMKKFNIQETDPLWPSKTQNWVAEACENEIKKRGATIESYLPKKGDVLFWHGRLLHRGSKPKNSFLQRKSLICHYSSVNHRPDFPDKRVFKKDQSEGIYFFVDMPLEGPQRV